MPQRGSISPSLDPPTLYTLVSVITCSFFTPQFVYNMMVCSKSHNNKPIEEFVLVSPAPVDTAAKLSNIMSL
jgi:hypothetical protein